MSDKQGMDLTNIGLLFKNNRRANDKQPTHKGKINIEGVDYWLSGWLRRGLKEDFIKLEATKQEPRAEDSGEVF